MSDAATTASGQNGALKQKPSLCENCEENEPAVLASSPTLLGKAGLPLDVWLCGWCAAKVPRQAKKRRRKTKGRLAAGRYGTTVMRLAFRYGGFTARQLAEFLLLESPRRFYRDLGVHTSTDVAQGDEEARARALKSATKAAYKHLAHLRGQGLVRSVDVWREHFYGERDGRAEDLYHLEGRGILWAAALEGVGNDQEALKAYERHQLPKEPEHAAYRNDVYLRMLRDIAVERGFEERAGSGDPGYVVLSGTGDFSGESDPSYPYQVGPYRNKKGEESPRRGRTHEWLYPDGRAVFGWADGLECAFDVEAERTSGAVKGAQKLDRYGAYWLRLYKLHEERLKEPERAPLARKLAGMEAERKKVLKVEGTRELEGAAARKHPHLAKTRFREVREKLAEIDAREMPFSGLPGGIVPVVFVHPTRTKSANVRRSFKERRTPAPRFDAFLEYVSGRMFEWAVRELVAINDGEKDPVAGWRSGGTAPEYARHVLESLLVFASWEALQPAVRKNLPAGEVHEVDPVGGTLGDVYAPLGGDPSGGQKTSLRSTAGLRQRLKPQAAQTGGGSWQ